MLPSYRRGQEGHRPVGHPNDDLRTHDRRGRRALPARVRQVSQALLTSGRHLSLRDRRGQRDSRSCDLPREGT
ncbi:hypothetical protein VARIO8X_20151 [Burkholderiales bacterium 8X]|nr:hypothetical protein VARIO8X_20151 [Burkholderiales bacterium 8X]